MELMAVGPCGCSHQPIHNSTVAMGGTYQPDWCLVEPSQKCYLSQILRGKNYLKPPASTFEDGILTRSMDPPPAPLRVPPADSPHRGPRSSRMAPGPPKLPADRSRARRDTSRHSTGGEPPWWFHQPEWINHQC